jgi:hypothetical protein
LTFIIKNTILNIVSGLGWTLIAIYLFNLAGSGDPDYGRFTWGFAFVATILAMAMFFNSWWAHRKKTVEITKGKNFYDETFEETFKDLDDIHETRRKIRKLRQR